MLVYAFSLFFLSWFSNDDAENSKTKDDQELYQNKEIIDKKIKSMTRDDALNIMYENGFSPQIPVLKLPVNFLKVQDVKSGKKYQRRSILESKKPSIIHFWATWCGPCKRELPKFDILAKKLSDTISIYTITSELMDGSEETAQKIWQFYKMNGLENLNVVADENNSLAAGLGVTGIPATFLIDSKGNIVGQFLGSTEWSKPDLIAALTVFLTQ